MNVNEEQRQQKPHAERIRQTARPPDRQTGRADNDKEEEEEEDDGDDDDGGVEEEE